MICLTAIPVYVPGAEVQRFHCVCFCLSEEVEHSCVWKQECVHLLHKLCICTF